MTDETQVDRKPPIPTGGKRLGMEWCSWMSDWFTSHSPRNGNSNAEGPWAQWVDMALQILQHPATAIVRPELQGAVKAFESRRFYSEADVYLTDEQIAALFEGQEVPW